MKTEHLHVRVEAEFVARLDAWRREKMPVLGEMPSRGAALRHLAEKGLALSMGRYPSRAEIAEMMGRWKPEEREKFLRGDFR